MKLGLGIRSPVLPPPQDHPRHLEAVQLLDTFNPNANKNAPDGLQGVSRRYVGAPTPRCTNVV